MDVVLLEGVDLEDFLRLIRSCSDANTTFILRVAIDEDGLKVKPNSLAWSAPFGIIDTEGAE
jgi:hypothetical protein